VAELLAEMIDYANHTQRHAADPKAREYVQRVLAAQRGISGGGHFRNWFDSAHSSLVAMRRIQVRVSMPERGEFFNSFKYRLASLQRELNRGLWHS